MALNLLWPRLEWNDVVLTGDISSGSPTINNISTTDDLKVGMVINNVGVPADTTIISKTATTVTMSANATMSMTTVVTFFERLDFQYPPTKDTEDKLKAQNKISTSLSGVEQVQTDFIEATRDLEFWFLTKEETLKLRMDFYAKWAVYGKEFRYFLDQDDSDYEIYTLNSYSFDQQRQVKKHPYFLYKLSMSFRRVFSNLVNDVMLLEDGDNLIGEGGEEIAL